MTININKEVGSKSNITIKGLGDPGPFSFAIIKGSLPTGTTFDQATGEIKGNFTQKGDFDVTIAGKKKDRIQGSEDFTFKVTDWTLHRTDFKNLVDNNSLSWTTTGTVTKILTDPGIFDGECYEVNGRLTINLPEAIGTRDFEIDYIFKPLNNGSGDAYGRILMIGPNSTSGMFLFCRTDNLVPATIRFHHCPNDSTSYANTFPNVSNPLINDDWNHILLVRKNGVLTYFLNGVREQENSFTLNMDRRELYIGANNSGTERFSCRVKRLQIRVYDNSHFNKQNLVTNVWKYKLKERTRYQLKSTERNNYLIECNFTGNYTTRVKEGYSLPTGLTLKDNKITGDSTLTNNLSIRIELLVAGVVNDEVAVNILDVSKPYRVFELPLVGTENDTVFGDTQSRQWTRRGDVKVVKDTDNFRDLTATYFDGAADSLYFTSDEFILGYDDFCYSFWLKPIDAGGTVSFRRIFNHGSNNVNGTFVLADDYTYFYSSPPNITFYLYNNGWQKISTKADKLNDGFYNHIVIARKNNVWRVLINGKLVLETTYQINLTGNTLYIASIESNTENYKGNYFDFKLSRYVLDYWEPFIPPVITKWSSAPITINEQVNTDINKKFVSTWPHGGVTYKVSNSSALPLGLTLESSGLITGASTNVQAGTTIIECYINNVLNHTTTLTFDIVADVRSKYLTHSLKAYASNANGLEILKSSSSITTTLVSPVMTEVGPMLSLEFKNPYTAYGSLISIPHAETQLSKKAFCMELEIYFGGGLSIVGRGRAGYGGPQPLICKSYNGPAGEQGIYITEANGDFLLSLNSSSSIPNALNESSFITFDKSKRNHIAITYDLEKLRFFVNGKLEKVIDWVEGWASYATQNLELGQQMIGGYPGYFSAYTGFLDNFKLYQGSAIYTRDFTPELNSANLYPEFPVIEPNKPYKGSIVGINGHTVSLLTGSLPPGLSLSTDGKLTGTCTVTNGDYPVTFTVVKGTTIENISVSLTVAQYILDLNLNNAITNGTLTDNIGNIFTVNGNPTIQADASFSSGRSIYFNGSDSYLSIPADKIFKLGKSDFVLEFEFKAVTDPLPDGGSFPGIISQRGNASSQHAFSVWLATGYSTSAADKIPYSASNKMSVGISTTTVGSVNAAGAVECSGVGLVKNKVYKVKFVRSGTTIRLYIDDRLMESVAIPADYTLFNSNQNLLIGCLDNTSITNRLFNGYLGSLKVYAPNSAALSDDSTQINKDPYWENVFLYLKMDGPDGGTMLTDTSTRSNTVTTYADAKLSTAQSMFNGASLHVPGTRSSRVDITGPNVLDIGDRDFTIEAWVLISDVASDGSVWIVGAYGTSTGCYGDVYIDNTNCTVVLGLLNPYASASRNCTFKTPKANLVNAWHFITWVRKDGIAYIYIDGVQVATAPFTATISPAIRLRIGGMNHYSGPDSFSVNYSFNGYIDEVRITEGIARYTGNFTPPTGPFPKTGVEIIDAEVKDPYFNNVTLLLDMEGAVGSADIIDRSPRTKVISSVLGAKLSSVQSKAGLTSLSGENYIGAKVEINSHQDFNMEGLDFTIECSVYLYGLSNGSYIEVISRRVSTGYWTFSIFIDEYTGKPRFSICNTSLAIFDAIGTESVPFNRWFHIAGVRYMNTIKLFIDGIEVASTPVSGTTYGSNEPVLLFGTNNNDTRFRFNGLLDELRITKGVARYTSGFTPPSGSFPRKAPVVGDPLFDNVTLLLSFDGANGTTTITDNSKLRNQVTVVGSAAISTTQSKFGGSSLAFYGGAGYIEVPNIDFTSGDWTVEFMLYMDGGAGSGYAAPVFMIGTAEEGADGVGLSIFSSDGNYTLWLRNSYSNIVGGAFTRSKFIHIAITKESGKNYIFIEGVKSSPLSTSVNFGVGKTVRIGTSSGQWLQSIAGYIDELRITKGIARYTSGFTPPSKPFPKTGVEIIDAEVKDPYFNNVTLLLDMEGANDSTAFIDNSPAPKAITASGGAKISTAQSQWGGASAYFPGASGNRITIPAGDHFNFGAGDFTIEAWVRPSSVSDNKAVIGQYGFSGNRSWDFLLLGNVAHFRFTSGGVTDAMSLNSPVLQAGVSSHIAVVRSGSNFYVFANGVLGETKTSTAPIYSSSYTAAIGYNQEGAWPFFGYIDELRITKGVGRYTGNFTPPTGPFPKS